MKCFFLICFAQNNIADGLVPNKMVLNPHYHQWHMFVATIPVENTVSSSKPCKHVVNPMLNNTLFKVHWAYHIAVIIIDKSCFRMLNLYTQKSKQISSKRTKAKLKNSSKNNVFFVAESPFKNCVVEKSIPFKNASTLPHVCSKIRRDPSNCSFQIKAKEWLPSGYLT